MADSKKSNTVIKVGPFVGSYVTLHTPRAVNEGDEPKYSISLIVPKNLDPKSPASKSFAELKLLIDRVAREKFGPKYRDIPNFKLPIRDGDSDKPDHKEYAESYFFNCSSFRPPGVVDRHLKRITTKEEFNDRAYSGCKFIVQVSVFAYDKKLSKGVSVGLNNVAMVELGTRIDGRQDAAAAFAGDFEEDDSSSSGSGDENPLD